MPTLQRGGLAYDPDIDEVTSVCVYLPVNLRTAPLLWLRTFWARNDEGVAPKAIGDIRTRIRVYSVDELTDTVVLEGTWDNDVTISSVALTWEQHYYDIDISSCCDADTSHLTIEYQRTGTNPADTLGHEAMFVNSYTLVTQQVEVE